MWPDNQQVEIVFHPFGKVARSREPQLASKQSAKFLDSNCVPLLLFDEFEVKKELLEEEEERNSPTFARQCWLSDTLPAMRVDTFGSDETKGRWQNR